MEIDASAELWYWRGPSPFHFLTVPKAQSLAIKKIAPLITYGWGVLPTSAQVRETKWATSLIPKDSHYLLPIKNAVRFGEALEIGEIVNFRLSFKI